MEDDPHTDGEIRSILSMRRVAVVGMSRDPGKAAHAVPKYLSENGFDITPVNPDAGEILGRRCYRDVADVEGEVDIVEVFRPPRDVLPVVESAIGIRPRVIWLQEGIHNRQAEDLARRAGIDVVFNRCMLAEHMRLCRRGGPRPAGRDLPGAPAGSGGGEADPPPPGADPGHGATRIRGGGSGALARARSGLADVSELSVSAAEHHPLWGLLFHSCQISSAVLDGWDGDLTAAEIDEIRWSVRELDSACKRLEGEAGEAGGGAREPDRIRGLKTGGPSSGRPG